MTLDEIIYNERRKVYKLKDKAWRAQSAKVSQERREEAEYHECVVKLLEELKWRRGIR